MASNFKEGVAVAFPCQSLMMSREAPVYAAEGE